jgi:hypothetical protein
MVCWATARNSLSLHLSGSLKNKWSLPQQPVNAPKAAKVEMKLVLLLGLGDDASADGEIWLLS